MAAADPQPNSPPTGPATAADRAAAAPAPRVPETPAGRSLLDDPETLLKDPGPNVKSLAWAVRMHRDGNLYGAANAYNEILKRHPDHPDVLHLLGLLLAEAGRPDRALDFLRKANELRPNDEAFCLSLGEVYRQAGALREALDALSRAATLNPNLAEAWVSLGNTLSETGQFEDAIQVFREALEIRPDSPKLLMALADALLVQDRLDDAAEAYKHLLVADPTNADGYARLAATLVASGRESAAATLFDHHLLLYAKPLRQVEGWSSVDAFNARLARWLHRAWCLDAGLPVPEDGTTAATEEPDEPAMSDPNESQNPTDETEGDQGNDDGSPEEAESGTRSAGLAIHRQDALRAAIIAAELDGDGTGASSGADSAVGSATADDPEDDSALAALDSALAGLADDHVRAIARSGHPYGDLAPSRWQLINGKAMRPEDLAEWRYGGKGYLSGLYIPATGGAASDDGSYAGWLEFGPPTVDDSVAESATRRVSPRDGLLLLFPSWFWHRLIPPTARSADKWVALAFDLAAEVPAEEIPPSDKRAPGDSEASRSRQNDRRQETVPAGDETG